MDTRETIVEFIIKNGWKEVKIEYNDSRLFDKQDNITIEIFNDEIVLLDDTGDFMHIKINGMTLYFMLGYFMHNRFIAIDYKWINQ